MVDVEIIQPFPLTFDVGSLHRPVNDGQGLQAEKVELHQPGGFHIVLVVLGHQVGAVFLAIERREIRQLARCNHHAPGVLAHVPGQAFQFQRHFPDFVGGILVGVLVAFQELAQGFFLLKRLFQGHPRGGRNHLGETVCQAIGLALDPRHIAHHRLGGHGAEGDDLAHRITAVLVGHIVDYPVTLLHAEIHIEVRHGYPFRVKETFEQQVVANGIQIGNLEGIGHQRASAGPPPRPYRHLVVLTPLNEVGNNQEVTGKAHLIDDIQLELEPVVIVFTLAGVLRVISVQQYLKAIFQPIPGQLFEILLDGHAIRNRKVRQKILAQANIQGTAAGDFDGVFQRFRQI